MRDSDAPVSGLLEHQARKVARRIQRRLAIADALTGKARTVARADAATRLLALARHGCAAAVPAKTTPPKEAANGNG